MKYVTQMQYCWQHLIGMAAMTFVVSAVYVFLLKWLTKPLLYISIVLILLGFGLLGIFLWLRKEEYVPKTCKEVNGL